MISKESRKIIVIGALSTASFVAATDPLEKKYKGVERCESSERIRVKRIEIVHNKGHSECTQQLAEDTRIYREKL